MTSRRDDTGQEFPLPNSDPSAVPTGLHRPSDDNESAQSTEAYRPTAPRAARYPVHKFHARGGMGEVWLAEDAEIGRKVALKRLRKERATQQDRFLAEAKITGQLVHPGIVPVHDLGLDEEGQPYYVMAFVKGQTLKAAIAEDHNETAPKTSREMQHLRLLEVFIHLCQTMAYAHSRGVIHRDLKPDNVMLGPFGETFVLDWGLAKVLGQPESVEDSAYVHLNYPPGGSSETVAGTVLGAPPYMAPEVAEGRAGEADQRTDIYLLGSTLYEILTGRPPRQGTSRSELVEQARTMQPTPPRKVNKTVPKPMEAICLKAMARRPEDRYASAQDLAEDVRRYLAGEPVSAYREGILTARVGGRGGGGACWGRGPSGSWSCCWVWLRWSGCRQADADRLEALNQAELHAKKEQARVDVKEFRRLADEAHFFAASTNPVAERAPYFDPNKGEKAARAADAIAQAWGPSLEALEAEEERPALRRELYDLLLLLAQIHSQASDDARTAAQDALDLLDRAKVLAAPSQGFYRVQASCFRRLGRVQETLDAERLAADAGTPISALDHFLLGESLRQQPAASLPEALEQYQQAVRMEPTHYWSHFQRGRCFLALGQDERAVEALSGCVTLRPTAPWAYSTRGLALALGKRFPEAERDLAQALELLPDFRPARLNLGAVYWLKKDYDQALARVRQGAPATRKSTACRGGLLPRVALPGDAKTGQGGGGFHARDPRAAAVPARVPGPGPRPFRSEPGCPGAGRPQRLSAHRRCEVCPAQCRGSRAARPVAASADSRLEAAESGAKPSSSWPWRNWTRPSRAAGARPHCWMIEGRCRSFWDTPRRRFAIIRRVWSWPRTMSSS